MLGFFARRTLDAESPPSWWPRTFAEAFASRSRFPDEGLDGVGWLYGIGLGYLLPLVVLGLVVWFLVDHVRRRRAR
jgi:hypothetical protein